MRNMKRQRLELADAAFHASHESKLLTSCPLCFGIARKSLQGKNKDSGSRLAGGKRSTKSDAPLKLPPLNTKRSGYKITSNSSQRTIKGKGSNFHTSVVAPVKEDSLGDELSPSEVAYLSSVVNARSRDADLFTTDAMIDDLQRENGDIASQILRQCLMEISSIHWEMNIDGLMKITDMLRYSPHVVSESGCLPSVVRSLTCLVGSQRSRLCIAACRTACSVFKRLLCIEGPDFNHLVSALLIKSCDTNRFVRQEADRALDAMAAYVPPYNSVFALLDQEGRQSDVEVRSATARTLDLVVEYQGPEALLDSKETRDKLWPALAIFVDDVHPATRDYAAHTCESLAHDPRFARQQRCWQQRLDKCPPQLRKRLYRYVIQGGGSPL